jgi:hypothetical protein
VHPGKKWPAPRTIRQGRPEWTTSS